MLRIFENFVFQVKVGGGRGEVGDFLTFASVMYAYFCLVVAIITWLSNATFLFEFCCFFLVGFKVDDWVIPLRDSLSLRRFFKIKIYLIYSPVLS